MDHDEHYARLFSPLEERFGPIDPDGIGWIVGFDAGGPVSLSTIGRGRSEAATYVTCELTLRDDQRTEESAPFELLITCDDESFAVKILTTLADLSLNVALGDGHLIHLDELARPGVPAVALEAIALVEVAGRHYALHQVLGLSDTLLNIAVERGVDQAIAALKETGTYPKVLVSNG